MVNVYNSVIFGASQPGAFIPSHKIKTMKILVVADIHGDFQTLEKILKRAGRETPDVVVSPGNTTDLFKTPPEFSQLDIADLVLQKLLSLHRPVLCVPGNHDPHGILDVFDDYGANLHGKHKIVAGVGFIGFGGAKTPFNTPFEPTEEETKEALSSLAKKPHTVLVVHDPPKNTRLDKIKTGEHVGSQVIRDFILSKKPSLTIAAHIHEAAGEDTLGGTVLFNPGPAFNGNYGIVELDKKKIICTRHTLKT